jgi:uncharacterized protein with NRDE domain
MCLILVAVRVHPSFKLILAANRDEYHDRPTAKAAFWPEFPELLAGKDLRARGTWVGITTGGRIAAVTNYRDPSFNRSDAPSRGRLVSEFLIGQQRPGEYLERLNQKADIYNGFSLIVGEKEALYVYSNRDKRVRNLSAGIYGLSNHLLDTPWPKVVRGKEALERLLSDRMEPNTDAIFEILENRSIPNDRHLPDTGVGLKWERILSPIFVSSPTYGTRSSNIILIDLEDHVTFVERTFNSKLPPDGEPYKHKQEPFTEKVFHFLLSK